MIFALVVSVTLQQTPLSEPPLTPTVARMQQIELELLEPHRISTPAAILISTGLSGAVILATAAVILFFTGQGNAWLFCAGFSLAGVGVLAAGVITSVVDLTRYDRRVIALKAERESLLSP